MPYQILPNINIFQSSIWQTNSVVILNEAANIVIDPCYFPAEIQVIADFVNRSRSFNKYIIFTHSDFDHVVGYQHFKGARLIGQEEMKVCDAQAQLFQLREIDQTYYIKRKISFAFPEPDITFATNYRIPLRDDELVLFHAPGHTGDSCFIVSKKKQIMFAGDYLSNLEFPFVYFNTQAYIRTLDLASKLIDDFDIKYLVPGHGDAALNKEEITERISQDRDYLITLTKKAEELFVQGLQKQEITEVLKGLTYKGESITGAMLRMHAENIRLVLKEIQSY